MTKFEFEIQNCITVIVDAENVEDARMKLVCSQNCYADELILDCCISNGKELNK